MSDPGVADLLESCVWGTPLACCSVGGTAEDETGPMHRHQRQRGAHRRTSAPE